MFRSLVLMFVFCLQFANAGIMGVPPYDGAVQLDEWQGVVDKHRIALSKTRKVDGRLQFENEEKHSGLLVQTLYQIETEDTLEDIAAFYHARIAEAGHEVLFECKARLCGSSNEWANSVFHQKLLYGSDDRQFYWVLRQQEVWWVVYLVERGNKRIYLYTERMQPHAVRTDNKWFLPGSCRIGPDFIRANPELVRSPAEYVLVVSVTGADAVREADKRAAACAASLQEAFPGIRLGVVGLGDYASTFDRRVKSDQFILFRLNN